MKILLLFLIFISIGAIGNYFAVRHKPIMERRKWWLKFVVYVIWVSVILLGTWYFNWFYKIMAWLVIAIGLIEIFRYLRFKSPKDFIIIGAYGLIAAGFVLFSYLDTSSNQATLYTKVFILVCICDAFSQITGQLFGKTKILKKISPTKTLEGLLGGIFFVFITALFLFKDERMPLFDSIYFGIIVGIGAPIGDVLSSSLKRYLKIKDFGNYFPGQGGVLDRYDSHIFTGVLYFCIEKIA